MLLVQGTYRVEESTFRYTRCRWKIGYTNSYLRTIKISKVDDGGKEQRILYKNKDVKKVENNNSQP